MCLFILKFPLQMLNKTVDHYFIGIHSSNLVELIFLKNLENNKLVYETKARKMGMAKVNIFWKCFLYVVETFICHILVL